MNKEEILEKSRQENKNKDIYEQEIIKQGNAVVTSVMVILATVFFYHPGFYRRGNQLWFICYRVLPFYGIILDEMGKAQTTSPACSGIALYGLYFTVFNMSYL